MILERLGDARRLLLLQGPVGPFFAHLARFLLENGREVTKVHLNGGDAWFYDLPGAVDFNQPPDHWPRFVDEMLESRRIDGLILFGDCRPYHRAAILRARLRRVPVFVFEEGYIRPNHITFEPAGVNGFSSLPRSIALLRMLPVPKPDSKQIPSPFSRMARYATTYYLAGRLYRSRYPNYRHHKPFEIYPEAWYWIRSGLRKAWFKLSERNVQARLSGSLAKSSSWSRCRYTTTAKSGITATFAASALSLHRFSIRLRVRRRKIATSCSSIIRWIVVIVITEGRYRIRRKRPASLAG